LIIIIINCLVVFFFLCSKIYLYLKNENDQQQKQHKMGSNSSKNKESDELTEEKIQLLLNNTHFDRDQIEEWHQGFIRDCPKGKLDKKKFIDVYRQVRTFFSFFKYRKNNLKFINLNKVLSTWKSR
jgi:hypothetical protein